LGFYILYTIKLVKQRDSQMFVLSTYIKVVNIQVSRADVKGYALQHQTHSENSFTATCLKTAT